MGGGGDGGGGCWNDILIYGRPASQAGVLVLEGLNNKEI